MVATRIFNYPAEAASLAQNGQGLLVVGLFPTGRGGQLELNLGEFQVTNNKLTLTKHSSLNINPYILYGEKVLRVAPDKSIWILIRNNSLPIIHITNWDQPSSQITTVLMGKMVHSNFIDRYTTLAIGADNKAWLITRMPSPSTWLAAYSVKLGNNSINYYGPVPLGRAPEGAGIDAVAPTKSGDLWVSIGLSDNDYGRSIPGLAYLSRNGTVIGRFPVKQTFPTIRMHTIKNGLEIAEYGHGCFLKEITPKDIKIGSVAYLALLDSLNDISSHMIKAMILKENPISPTAIAMYIGTYAKNLFTAEEQVKILKMNATEAKDFIKKHHFSPEASHILYLRIMHNFKNPESTVDQIGSLKSEESCINDPQHPIGHDFESGVIGWIPSHEGYWTLTTESETLQRVGYSVFSLERRVSRKDPGLFRSPTKDRQSFIRANNIDPYNSKLYPISFNKVWVLSDQGHLLNWVYFTNQTATAPTPYNGIN